MLKRRHFKLSAALATVACVVAALLASSLIPAGSANVTGSLAANQNAAKQLHAEIASETAAIDKGAGAVNAAKQRLQMAQSELDEHVAQLRAVQQKLLNARNQLDVLEKKLHLVSDDLASNLRSMYENGTPNLVDVIVNSKGFSNLLQQVNFMKRTQKEDTRIVTYTQAARNEVLRYTVHLGNLEQSDRTLTNQILAQRNRVAAIEYALVSRQIAQERARSGAQSKLSHVNARISALRTKLNAIEANAQRQAQQTGSQINYAVGGIAIDTGGMVQAPPGAPQAVKEMIAAGNAIATLPYIWGGGHSSFVSPGYDCSGSVSYVLAAAGLLSAPLDSEGFASYGDSGPGKWVTIYVDPGVHVWMTIAGWRFDTVSLAETGSRWSRGGGEFAGFEQRHPPGL